MSFDLTSETSCMRSAIQEWVVIPNGSETPEYLGFSSVASSRKLRKGKGWIDGVSQETGEFLGITVAVDDVQIVREKLGFNDFQPDQSKHRRQKPVDHYKTDLEFAYKSFSINGL